MKRIWMTVIAASLAAACSKGKSAPKATPEVDALWAMAPKQTDAGLVLSIRAMAMIENAQVALEEVGHVSPPIGELVEQLEQQLGKSLPSGRLARWADLGLTAQRASAIFHVPGGAALIVVPVADRDKFLAATGGRAEKDGDHLGRFLCRSIGDHYVCSDDPTLLDAPRAEPAGRHASALHGDVEVWVAKSLLNGGGPAVEVTGDLEVAATIERGQITARVHLPVHGLAIDALAKADRVKAPDAGDASGILVANLTPAIAALPKRGGAFGINEALRALAGPVTVVARPGTLDLDARVALRDADAIRQVVTGCDHIVPPGAGITATPSKDGCHVHVDLPMMPPGFDFDVWIDGDTLRASHDRSSPVRASAEVPPTEIGKELGDGSWTWVAWGRGAMNRTMAMGGAPAAGVMTFFVYSEVGIGVRVRDDGVDGLVHVRTIWSNPDEVVAALVPMIAKAVRSEDIAADVAAVAARFPDSPYAADMRAGAAGLMVPTALVGMLAAVAIPAFLEYQHAGKRSEAEIALGHLGKNAKAYYIKNASFPVGTESATPAVSCCAQPGQVCAANASDWRLAEPGHPWAELEFEMIDDGRFQYDYTGTAESFTAHAIADLDCDMAGTTTYTIIGTALNGVPKVEVSGPIGDD